ncbi:MAG TPA: opioid growth factor receptor-related protein [Burkholderiaceae bacterium]|nr:opioid growth factor receptor-related protein [Burkholderiaceae bacterium]
MARPSLDVVRSFLAGSGTDNRGRTLDQILRQDDDWLEDTHDFIQWLFPIDSPSGVNPDAPVVTAQAARRLCDTAAVPANLHRSLCRMAAFYGLAVQESGIERAANYLARVPVWAMRPTHNDLRITRILRSLTLFGLLRDAHRFRNATLAAIREYRRDARVERYWEAAISG